MTETHTVQSSHGGLEIDVGGTFDNGTVSIGFSMGYDVDFGDFKDELIIVEDGETTTYQLTRSGVNASERRTTREEGAEILREFPTSLMTRRSGIRLPKSPKFPFRLCRRRSLESVSLTQRSTVLCNLQDRRDIA